MAYVFFILKENAVITGKPVSTNDNLTYRLMEMETETEIDNGMLTSEENWSNFIPLLKVLNIGTDSPNSVP